MEEDTDPECRLASFDEETWQSMVELNPSQSHFETANRKNSPRWLRGLPQTPSPSGPLFSDSSPSPGSSPGRPPPPPPSLSLSPSPPEPSPSPPPPASPPAAQDDEDDMFGLLSPGGVWTTQPEPMPMQIQMDVDEAGYALR